MPYSPTSWVDGTTPVNAANLNKIETELGVLDGRPVIPTPLVEGRWLHVSGGAMVWAQTSYETIIDAKGDLIAGQANDTPVRLPVGSDGQVLTADVAQTLGVKWAAAPGGAVSLVTALPGSPVDGQECVLVDSLTAPTWSWRLRYVAGITDAYKWLAVGAVPAEVEIATSESTASTTYVDLTTVGPQFTIPRAGIYLLEFNVGWSHNASATGAALTRWVALKLGAAATSDNDGAATGDDSSSAAGKVQTGVMRRTLAAADVVKMQYRKDSATGSAEFRNRALKVTPLRVS